VPKGEAPDIAALRQFLAQHLPNYMIPNAFIMLDRIPISANGKADRKALPDPTSACSVSTEYVAPGNSTERKLAQIWAETLGVEKIGIHDNFFELGGHSVLAMQIANKALAHFEVELELIKLFENPTIAAIAEMIEGKLAEQQLLMNDEDGDDDEEMVI
jgi:acyl carrier protein